MASLEIDGGGNQFDTMDSIDDEIAQIRDQIQEMTKRRRLITNTLLSSTKIQSQINNRNAMAKEASIGPLPSDLPADENPLSFSSSKSVDPSASTITHQTNMHRLSFTVTTFPFTDPSPGPHNAHLHGRLLGIRLDHCSRHGTFQRPYYILLRRVEEGGDEWRVHRHTIPAFVSLGQLEEEFLPLKDADEDYSGGYESGRIASGDGDVRVRERGQDLHGFVRKVRHELICWELRRGAIELLKELCLLKDEEDEDEEMEGEIDPSLERPKPRGLYGVQSIEATAFEARQARITWADGSVARIKISNRGLVERAVVVSESGRVKGVENLLTDGESRIEELVSKLKILVGETT